MAALVLSAAGAAAGGARVRADRRHRRAHRRRARRQRHRPRAARRRQSRNVEGPRLSDLDVMASTEGAPIPRVYGRARIAGQVIWATQLEEVVVDTTSTRRRQGLGGGAHDHDDDLQLFRQFRRRAVRGPDRRASRASGPTASRSTSPASPCASIAGSESQTPTR